MKKISYKIILFTVLIAVALSVSISSVSIITSRNLMNKATDEQLSLTPYRYTTGINKKILESNLTISGIESILSHEIKNNQYFKDGSGKEQFLSEMTSKIIELVERIDVYWAYFYIVPEFNDLGTGVSYS